MRTRTAGTGSGAATPAKRSGRKVAKTTPVKVDSSKACLKQEEKGAEIKPEVEEVREQPAFDPGETKTESSHELKEMKKISSGNVDTKSLPVVSPQKSKKVVHKKPKVTVSTSTEGSKPSTLPEAVQLEKESNSVKMEVVILDDSECDNVEEKNPIKNTEESPTVAEATQQEWDEMEEIEEGFQEVNEEVEDEDEDEEQVNLDGNEGDIVDEEEDAALEGTGHTGGDEEDLDSGEEDGEEEADGVKEEDSELAGEEGFPEVDEEYLEGNEEEPPEEQELRPVTEKMKRRKFEVFVGGLNRDAVEEDLSKALKDIGENLEVRLMKIPGTNKNKGYAFVRFSNIEQATAAAALGRVLIRGKSCAIVPSEDNDTLYLSNINKSWMKDQVLEKIREYGVDGIEQAILVEDPHSSEGNRGFAYLEFASHEDAIKAHKRLSRRDAVFGLDRTAKVAWAMNSDVSDEVMSKVKSVFIDGIPASWSDEKAREQFSKYGDIERVVFARNMASAKRKDFAFVNYNTREGAVACVEAFKNLEHLEDGENKVKVKVHLAKPRPNVKFLKRNTRGGYFVSRGAPGKFGRGRVNNAYVARGRGRGLGGRGYPNVVRKPGRAIIRGGGGSWNMGCGLNHRDYDGYQSREPVPFQAVDDRSYFHDRPSGRRLPARGGYSRREDFRYERPRPPTHGFDQALQRPPLPPRRVLARDNSYGARGTGYTESVPNRRMNHPDPPPFRDNTYSGRIDRGPAYERSTVGAGYAHVSTHGYNEVAPGSKRPYSAMVDDGSYYETGARGYPRARMDYEDSLPPYSEPPMRAPLGRANAGPRHMNEPPIYESRLQSGRSGYGSSQGYGSGHRGSTDYAPNAPEIRGPMYGGRSGSGGYGSGSADYY